MPPKIGVGSVGPGLEILAFTNWRTLKRHPGTLNSVSHFRLRDILIFQRAGAKRFKPPGRGIWNPLQGTSHDFCDQRIIP